MNYIKVIKSKVTKIIKWNFKKRKNSETTFQTQKLKKQNISKPEFHTRNLKKHISKENSLVNYTKIGSKDYNVFGNSYLIPDDKVKEFYNNLEDLEKAIKVELDRVSPIREINIENLSKIQRFKSSQNQSFKGSKVQ